MSGLRSLAAVATAALWLVACGSETRIDGNSLETAIAEELVPGAPNLVGNISCPDIPVDGTEASFTCVAVLDGVSVDVTVRTGEAEGSVVIEAAPPLVDADAAARLIATRFTDELGLDTAVDCGPPWAVLTDGETLECTATDPRGVERVFDVAVDDEGELDLTLR